MAQPAHFIEMSDEDFLKEATAIVENAQSREVYRRLLGAFTIYVHSLDNEVVLTIFK